MNGPLITVVTITYNAEAYIERTLESVRSQHFDDYEHVIVDGASKDRTLDIIRLVSGPKVRLLSEPDRGLYDAMNKGLLMAKGQYVLFLNAGDTFCGPEVLAAYAAKCLSGADIVYADTRLVDDHGNYVGDRHLSAPEVLTADSFKNGMLICHQAFMVRKEIAPMYDLQYRFSADYDWCVKCIKASKAGNNHNLHMKAIDYLTDGLTGHNKMRSLRERYRIMCEHYGMLSATLHHIGFVPRAVKRRLVKQR